MAKLVPFDEYKAPWETGDGVVDPEKIKKHYWNLLGDNESLKDKNATLTTQNGELQSKVTEFENKGLSADEKLQRELEAAKRENEQLKAKADKPDKLAIAMAAIDGTELTMADIKKAVKWVHGDTAEELESNFKEYIAEHHADAAKTSTPPRRQPNPDHSGITTGLTGDDKAGETEDGHYANPAQAYANLRGHTS